MKVHGFGSQATLSFLCSFSAYFWVNSFTLWLEQWGWASERAMAAVVMLQLHSQRAFLFWVRNRKWGEKQRLHFCLHSTTVFAMATGLSTVQRLLPLCSHLLPSLFKHCIGGAQVQSYNAFLKKMFLEKQQSCYEHGRHFTSGCESGGQTPAGG